MKKIMSSGLLLLSLVASVETFGDVRRRPRKPAPSSSITITNKTGYHLTPYLVQSNGQFYGYVPAGETTGRVIHKGEALTLNFPTDAFYTVFAQPQELFIDVADADTIDPYRKMRSARVRYENGKQYAVTLSASGVFEVQ
jgi:hypothetical protein